jgi:hypothetical protein
MTHGTCNIGFIELLEKLREFDSVASYPEFDKMRSGSFRAALAAGKISLDDEPTKSAVLAADPALRKKFMDAAARDGSIEIPDELALNGNHLAYYFHAIFGDVSLSEGAQLRRDFPE